jgi:hypothetical protein
MKPIPLGMAKPKIHQNSRTTTFAARKNREGSVIAPSITITWDAMPSPESEALPREIQDRLEVLFETLNARPAQSLPEIQRLCRQFPKLDYLRNWEWSCHRLLGNKEIAKELCGNYYREKPDYLFSRLTLVELLIEDAHLVAAEELLYQDGRSLPEINPDRPVFHGTEYRLWNIACSTLEIAKGNLEKAQIYRDILSDLEPNSPHLAQLDEELAYARIKAKLSGIGEQVRANTASENSLEVDDPEEFLEDDLADYEGPLLRDSSFVPDATSRLRAWVSERTFGNGIGQVLVARFKASGDGEVGIFLVNVFCLGVNQAGYRKFDAGNFEQFLEEVFAIDPATEVRPAYARKLIEQSVDYATKLGFAPHPEYKKACRVLGGVNANTCLDNFTFGKDGKPFYFQGPRDSPARVDQILKILTAKCGTGNFDFMIDQIDHM